MYITFYEIKFLNFKSIIENLIREIKVFYREIIFQQDFFSRVIRFSKFIQVKHLHISLFCLLVNILLCMLISRYWYFNLIYTKYKVSVLGVFIVSIFPHLVRMRENTDHENSEYRHFPRSVSFEIFQIFCHYFCKLSTVF